MRNYRDEMSKTFDIGLERLTGGGGLPIGTESVAPVAEANILGTLRGTFFLETFGCQMNDHDSEKVAGRAAFAGVPASGDAGSGLADPL